YLKAVVLDSVLHKKKDILNHMHVTFNPMIYGEAAIVDGNGSIHLWKGERHEDYSKLFIKYDFKTIRTSQVEVDLSPKDLWKTCEYGAHPQTLLVASRISADLFDFRSRDVTLIYDTNNEDKIFSFQRSPTGALYSQAFHAKDKTDITIRPSIPSNRFNLQIIEMSDSIASLHSLADMDVGTMPELRVKQSQNWHFEKIWDCKCFPLFILYI
ncbi:hypothetical protein RhiirC2_740124, partial [Rhizophagus irregularis]